MLNAGDGTHEHPTQALLDAFTMRRHFRAAGAEPAGDFADRTVVIVGDLTHSGWRGATCCCWPRSGPA